MYYKISKNKKVIDLLTRIQYVKYQEKHKQILLCDSVEAEAILSSTGEYGWHIRGLYHFKPDNHEYQLVEISKYQYDSLKKELGAEEG